MRKVVKVNIMELKITTEQLEKYNNLKD